MPAVSSAEWEVRLGEQIRTLRERRGLSQAELARRANVDRTTLVRLELGKGGTLRSLIGVVRALDREHWLDSLAPPQSVSPMDLLRGERTVPGGRRRRR